jgi:hypothetical protein
MKAFYENKLLAIKWLFYVRDVREGVGERQLFRTIIQHLCNTHTDMMVNLIQYVPFYGRWDDLLCVLNTPNGQIVIEMIRKQFGQDIKNMSENKPISLMAKWLPSANASSKETRATAKKLIKAFGTNERTRCLGCI